MVSIASMIPLFLLFKLDIKRKAAQRDKDFLSSKGKETVIKSYAVKPPLLYFDDITTDPNDWRNNALSKYYDLKSTRLE